ncbi:MAG: hypothetical protein GX239_06340, partial [Clostridiaceae bacterium]|nr:hypothetical protein [Clostridiaceae bacterium]
MKRIRKTICLLLFGFLFAALSNQVLAAEDTVSDEIKTANYTVESSSIQETSVSGVEEVEQLQTDLQESNLTIPLELDVVEDEPEVISTDIATEIGVTENTVSLADHETSLTDEIHSSVAGNEEGEAKVDGQSDPDSTDLTLEETIDTATEEAEEILERDEAEVTEQHITEADEQNITEVAEPDSAEGVEQDVAEATEPVAVEVIEPDSAEVIEQDVAEATEPVAVEVAEPEPAEGVERDVAEATEPVAVEVIEPEPAEGVERDVVEATETVAVEVIEPEPAEGVERDV